MLDAALELVGTHGIRALTHGRIDERAGVPRGSTSNYFRTRAALLTGVVDHLTTRELADFDPGMLGGPIDADVLAASMAGLIEMQATTFRTRTLARYVFFLEGTHNPDLQRRLDVDRQRVEGWVTSVLDGLGAQDAVGSARILMAAADGLLLHRLTVGRDVDLTAALAAMIRSVLAA